MTKPTYSPGRFSYCRFCRGSGCAACDGEYLRWKNPPAEPPPPTRAEIDQMYANAEANGLYDSLSSNPREAATIRTSGLSRTRS